LQVPERGLERLLLVDLLQGLEQALLQGLEQVLLRGLGQGLEQWLLRGLGRVLFRTLLQRQEQVLFRVLGQVLGRWLDTGLVQGLLQLLCRGCCFRRCCSGWSGGWSKGCLGGKDSPCRPGDGNSPGRSQKAKVKRQKPRPRRRRELSEGERVGTRRLGRSQISEARCQMSEVWTAEHGLRCTVHGARSPERAKSEVRMQIPEVRTAVAAWENEMREWSQLARSNHQM